MSSTVRRQIAGAGPLGLQSINNPGTTETAFGLGAVAGAPFGGGVIVPLAAGNTGLYAGTGKVLHIRAEGTIAGLSSEDSTTLALTFYEVTAAAIQARNLTPTTFGSGYNSVSAPSGAALNNASGASSFQFDAFLQLDEAGDLSGYYNCSVDGAAIVPQTIITDVSGLLGEADLNFLMAATLGGTQSHSVPVITLNTFAININE